MTPRVLISPLIPALLLGLTGCTTTSVYAPEHLADDTDRTVTVHTKDGAIIRFAPEDYDIISGEQDSLAGTGEIVTNRVNNATARWEGSIAFKDIESVSVTELNILGDVVWVGAVVVAAYTLTHLSPYGWY